MKLLFDQNLSPRLVRRLSNLYPDSEHVDSIGVGEESDRVVWQYAKQHNYLIVTKDSDFSELILLLGFPPKVIWIRRGNCSTDAVEEVLRDNEPAILELAAKENVGILTLF
ncbi:MAG: DUF5615 family PIN-like protein [Phormidesmis sp.]